MGLRVRIRNPQKKSNDMKVQRRFHGTAFRCPCRAARIRSRRVSIFWGQMTANTENPLL